jgi:hypothetical protein
MRIKIYIFFIAISYCLIISCSVNRKISSNNQFKGEIEIWDSNNYRFKYFLSVESATNLKFKIYNLAGIKISEFILKNDSLGIKYLIDDSFKVVILDKFKKNNIGYCLSKIIYDVFYGELFMDNEAFNKKVHCYNRNILLESNKKVYEISNLKYDRILTISESFVSNGNFEILLNNGIKVKLKIFS